MMNTVKQLFLLFCFLGISYSSFSGIIHGRTNRGFANKKVNLIQYKDYITYDYNIIESSIIDTSGKFKLNYSLKDTSQFLIQIEHLIGIIYLDPSKNYHIYFPPYSEDGTYKLTRNYTNIVFDSLDTDDVNGLILEVDRRLDQFFEDYINLLGSPQFKTALDTLKINLKEIYKDIHHPYFKNYVKYSVANLDLVATVKNQHINRLSAYNIYLINKPILLNDYAYMNFFHQFYEKELLTPSLTPTNKITEAINDLESLEALDTVLNKDYFFKDKRIRELAILSNIFELFYDERFSQKGMLAIVDQLLEESTYPEIKKIAQNIKTRLTKMKEGYPAIDFTLKDKNNKDITLSSFKGKYVYINFWTTWSKESQAEMGLYPSFIEKYGDYIEFVSINIDNQRTKFDQYIASNKDQNWTHLYFGGNTNLLDDYLVTNVPHYVLLDQDGLVIQNPAASPSPNGSYISIDKAFFDIEKKHAKTKRWEVGGKN